MTERDAPSSMRRDITSAYAASGARILSWFVIAALLFRYRESHYAMFALVRATVGLLNYTTLGLAPAMVRLIDDARERAAAPAEAHQHLDDPTSTHVLDYARSEEHTS